MKEQIKNIIESYCEGINHLEFNIADLDKMADEILALQLLQTGVMHSRRFNIDFNGNLLAGIEINKNMPFVFGAMDGYGNGINVSTVSVTEIIDDCA